MTRPMSHTLHPDVFEHVPMRLVREDGLDAVLADDGRLRVLFLWGRDCPNCDVAKSEMLRAPQRFRWPDVEWLQHVAGLRSGDDEEIFELATWYAELGAWPRYEIPVELYQAVAEVLAYVYNLKTRRRR